MPTLFFLRTKQVTSENRLNLPGVYWTRFSSLYTDVSDVEDKKKHKLLRTKHKSFNSKLGTIYVSHSQQATQMKGTYRWI